MAAAVQLLPALGLLPAIGLLPAVRLLPAVGLYFLSLAPSGGAGAAVLELRDADFDYLATEHETMLVKFYAPW